MPLSDRMIAMLRCPVCGGALGPVGREFVCSNSACARPYPVIGGIPLLANDATGIYQRDDFVGAGQALQAGASARSLGARIRKVTPSISNGDVTFAANMRTLVAALGTDEPGRPATILCIGTAADAEVIRSLLVGRALELVHMATRPGTAHSDILCDPRRWPFADNAADAVVMRGVLHRSLHVAEVAGEAVRVLRVGGLVYAEEPFAVASDEGPEDFYRFTHLGLRGQFLDCEEMGSGIAEGVGAALASSWRQLLWSLARSPYLGFALATIGSYTAFFWKHLDAMLGSRARAIDGAAAVYFLGRRSAILLSERELVASYRGAARAGLTAQPRERAAAEVFTEWAATNRDVGMEVGHAAAVEEMLTAAYAALGGDRTFTAVDAGCGNGWIVRRLRNGPRCRSAVGVDGSAGMIAKARALDPAGSYFIADLMIWRPPQPVDLVVSMEVLYYVEDPVALLRRIATLWLKPGGYAVIGIDHYAENTPSLGWPEYVGTRMTTWPEAQWLAAFEEAGFLLLRAWRAAPGPEWGGTLAMLAQTRAS